MEPLVGRTTELERIDAVLASRAVLPAGLLLHGREGIGKTVLWRAAVERATDRGYRVLACALGVNESRLTFAGLADLIGPVVDEVMPRLTPSQAQALRTALAIGGDGPAVTDERAVAFGLNGVLGALSRRSPIVLAIDDSQWLDPSSALTLSDAIGRLRHEPVLVVVAERDTAAATGPPLLPDDTALAVERILVGPLPAGAIHRLIRLRLGTSLTRPQVLRIHAASEGNPLHALELARIVQAGDGEASNAVVALLANRVASLPVAARRALALAAIATEPDLARLTAAHGPGLLDDLRPAVEAQLVTIGIDRVRFGHPLVATVAEVALSEAALRALHLRLAEVAASVEGRAAHLARATPEPSTDVAESIERAALITRSRGARAAAAELFDAAADLTPPTARRDHDRRRLAAAEAWYDAGDAVRAQGLLETLVHELAAGDLRCAARWRLGVLLDETGSWQEATQLWRAAIAETSEPGLESRILSSLAITSFYTTSASEAVSWAAAAVASAERSDDRTNLARALAVHAFTVALSGAPGYRLILDRALAVEAEVPELLGEWSPSAVAAEVARHTGDVAGSRQHYAAVLERAIAAGEANLEQWASFGLAHAEILAGNHRRASELADTVLDFADQTGQLRIPATSLRARIDALLGDVDGARRLVQQAIAGATATGEATHRFGAHIVLGSIEATAGEFAASAAAYAEARRLAVEIGLRHATARRGFVEEAEAAAAAGLMDQAEAAMAAFDSAVDGAVPDWAISIVHRARAQMLVARGELPAAADELTVALGAAVILPLDRGRAYLGRGLVLARLGDAGRSREDLASALETFTALGSPPWIERTQAELRRS